MPRLAHASANVQVPPGCGSREEFEREVQQRLGRGARAPNTSLQITAQGALYRLRMNVGGEQRELEDHECRPLFRAAVVVAVAITLSESSERKRTPPPPPAPAPAAVTPVLSEVPPAQSSSLRFGAALGAGLNLGLLPGAALALELQGHSLWRERFGLALGARYLASRTDRDEAGRGLTVDALGVQLGALYRPNGYWEAALGAAAYRLSAKGLGSGPREDWALAVGPTAGVAFLPVQRGPLWLSVGAEGHWNALRPSFVFLNYGPIFTAPVFDLSIFLRIGPRF